MVERRELSFIDWDAVLSDLRRLQETGYDKAGKWDLGQICKHLNDWLLYPIDGFPVASLPIRWMMSLLRVTIGKRTKEKILATGKMSAGGPTLGQTVYKTDPADEELAVKRLMETIERFRNHNGPIHPSPIFGPMDKDTAGRFQRVHCAHHLSFLVPKSA